MNSSLKNLIHRLNDVTVKLSYLTATDSSFEEMDKAINMYFAICEELESLGSDSIDELILEAQSQDYSRYETALEILRRNPSPIIVDAIVDLVNNDDLSISMNAGLALRCLKSAPKNLDSLFEGINKTDSFGQNHLKIAYSKWSEGDNIERIVPLIEEDKYKIDGSRILESLVMQRRQANLPIFESFLNHRNEEIQAVASAGLILLGKTEHSNKLIELAHTRKGETKMTAYNWMSFLMLPEFVPILLKGQAEISAKFRFYNVIRIGYIGINRSIELLLEEMKSNNRGHVEQTAFVLNQLTGERLYPNSFVTINKESLSIIAERKPNKRYFGRHLLTPEVLINELHKHGDYFWQLFSMTGESFGFDPNLSAIDNWESIRKWREWSVNNNHLFEPGAFYFLGEKREFQNEKSY